MNLLQRITARYEGPKSLCFCGHSGDGENSAHGGFQGHGPCKRGNCDCRQFTWSRWADPFDRALKHASRFQELVEEASGGVRGEGFHALVLDFLIQKGLDDEEAFLVFLKNSTQPVAESL